MLSNPARAAVANAGAFGGGLLGGAGGAAVGGLMGPAAFATIPAGALIGSGLGVLRVTKLVKTRMIISTICGINSDGHCMFADWWHQRLIVTPEYIEQYRVFKKHASIGAK